jgi:predicted transposase YdaD
VVIYLKESADEGFNGWFIGKCPIAENEEVLRFRYKEVKLWELDGMELLKRRLVGIYPLLVLTRLAEPAEGSLRQMIDEIKQSPDRLLIQDTLFAFKLLGSLNALEPILDRLIRRSDIMESPLLQEIYLEGMQEGTQQGLQQGLQHGVQQGELRGVRSSIIEILMNRFGLTSKAIKKLEKNLNAIEALTLLRRLLIEAATVKTPEEFTAKLRE